jgi:hypothetical protein
MMVQPLKATTHIYDVARLNAHIIYARRHGTRPDTIRVPGSPRDLDRVHIWISSDEGHDHIVDPAGGVSVECVQCNKKRKGPDL